MEPVFCFYQADLRETLVSVCDAGLMLLISQAFTGLFVSPVPEIFLLVKTCKQTIQNFSSPTF